MKAASEDGGLDSEGWKENELLKKVTAVHFGKWHMPFKKATITASLIVVCTFHILIKASCCFIICLN